MKKINLLLLAILLAAATLISCEKDELLDTSNCEVILNKRTEQKNTIIGWRDAWWFSFNDVTFFEVTEDDFNRFSIGDCVNKEEL